MATRKRRVKVRVERVDRSFLIDCNNCGRETRITLFGGGDEIEDDGPENIKMLVPGYCPFCREHLETVFLYSEERYFEGAILEPLPAIDPATEAKEGA